MWGINKAEQQRITVLYRKHGSLTPKILIRDAQAKSSPLHRQLYGKSESVLAMQRRIEIARTMISVWVVTKDPTEPKGSRSKRDRAYYSVPSLHAYKAAGEVKANADLRSEVIEAGLDRIRFVIAAEARTATFCQQYAAFLKGLNEFVERFNETVEGLVPRSAPRKKKAA